MTQWAPMDPFPAEDDRDGIPAADPGAGAPPTAPGYGVQGEEPDRSEETADESTRGPAAERGDDPPFRTPDPDDVSRR